MHKREQTVEHYLFRVRISVNGYHRLHHSALTNAHAGKDFGGDS